MASTSTYSLTIVPRDESAVAAELKALEATDKKALGRLLRVIRDIVDRGDDARGENEHLATIRPPLYMVRVSLLVAFYAYGRDNFIYLLSAGRRSEQKRMLNLAVARIVNVPPEI